MPLLICISVMSISALEKHFGNVIKSEMHFLSIFLHTLSFLSNYEYKLILNFNQKVH